MIDSDDGSSSNPCYEDYILNVVSCFVFRIQLLGSINHTTYMGDTYLGLS